MSNYTALPEAFLNKLKQFVPRDKQHETLESFCEEKPLTFRVNTLRATKREILHVLKSNAIPFTEVAWNEVAFSTPVNTRLLTSLPEYKDGKIYIQGLSSMIPALVLEPKPGEKILDLAAAPGSKTTQIASLMNNEGEIVANDMSRTRVFKLRANLNQQGVTNVNTTVMPGERIWRKFPEFFDKTLVDAPCTMEGRFKCDDPDSFKDWSPRKVKELSHRQQYLLRSAITATKVGGTIVYSTCTLSPEENEGVINWILEKEGDALTIEPIDIPHLSLSSGLTSWNGEFFSESLQYTARIYPNNIMEGFFIAKIKKHKTTLKPELFRK